MGIQPVACDYLFAVRYLFAPRSMSLLLRFRRFGLSRCGSGEVSAAVEYRLAGG